MLNAAILCYHATNIAGNSYQSNDLIAFADDLSTLVAHQILLVPAHAIADALLCGELPCSWQGRKVLALSCDDGTEYDVIDHLHESWGQQQSLLSSLRQHQAEIHDLGGHAHLSCFVIASPYAREMLDKTCMAGAGRWGDAWWPAALGSGLIGIGNHSWDHTSTALPHIAQRQQQAGSFIAIDQQYDADRQIRRACQYIRHKANNPTAALLAYPYGEASSYLSDDYLPLYGPELGLRAAFTTVPQYVNFATNPWRIPRLVCGDAWRSSAELVQLLAALPACGANGD